MAYPEPAHLNTTQAFAQYLNTVTDNWFWSAGILSIFVIILIWLSYRYPTEDAFAVSCYVCLLITFFARALDLVGDAFLLVFLTMTIIATLVLWTRSSSGR